MTTLHGTVALPSLFVDLDALRQRFATCAAERGWPPLHTPKNLASAIAVEAGELLAIFQWLTPEQSQAVMHDRHLAQAVEAEMADVLSKGELCRNKP
jgi:NTP pyrophosphatase (non-canonical NTP hydrolase)